MPSVHPFLDRSGPIAFAHRGGNRVAPENTMAAFADAVGLGYTHVETDVHVTSDGIVVAFHDSGLERLCGIRGRIGDHTWAELGKARVEGREPIPTLAELLKTWPDLRVNIDCKTVQAVGPLVALLESERCLDRVCLGSFSTRRLRRLRRHFGPALCTSAGPSEVARIALAATTGTRPAVPHAVAAAQVPTRQGPVTVVTGRFVDTCRSHGIKVHVWTVNERAEMDRLLDLGVDGIMSDDLALLKDVLMARNSW